jgi:hypothetical protein
VSYVPATEEPAPMVKQLRILWQHVSRALVADPGRFADGRP